MQLHSLQKGQIPQAFLLPVDIQERKFSREIQLELIFGLEIYLIQRGNVPFSTEVVYLVKKCYMLNISKPKFQTSSLSLKTWVSIII